MTSGGSDRGSFCPASDADKTAATWFAGRVAQVDPAALIRLEARGSAVDLWAKAGFGVLATQSIAADLRPSPRTVYATDLVAALAVSRAESLDPGSDQSGQWHTRLPAADGWTVVGSLASGDVAERVQSGLKEARIAMEKAREHELAAATKATVPPALLDSEMMSVAVGDERIPISMRLLFALSGMGFVRPDTHDDILVRITTTWLRLDATDGSVARRRMANLPLA